MKRPWLTIASTLLATPVAYLLSSYLLLFAGGAGWVPQRLGDALGATVYAPVAWYIEDLSHPGAARYYRSLVWAHDAGQKFKRP